MKVGETIGKLPHGEVWRAYGSRIEYVNETGHRVTHCFGTEAKLTTFLKSLGYRKTKEKDEEGCPIWRTKKPSGVRAALLAL